MSTLFYTVAGCTYLLANLVILRMTQTAVRAGSFWKVISPNFYEVPGQVGRFIAVGLCLGVTFVCIVIGRSLQLGQWPH